MTTRSRLLPLLLLAALLPSTATAPPHPVQALAPVEIVMAGFGSLRGLVVDDDGNVHVADREAGTVTRIAPDQTLTRLVSGLQRPVGLAFDLRGRLLVAEERAGRVVRVEAGGNRTPIVTGIKQPRWLAVDERGTVYVSARRLTRDGDPEPDDESAEPEVILAWAASGQLRLVAEDLRQVQGLVVVDGALYAATTGRRDSRHPDGVVFRIALLDDGSAGPPTPVASPDPLTQPIGLARDRLGALYVTTRELDLTRDPARRAVVKLQPGGASSLFASMLDDPQGLDLDATGNLYVADGRSGRVLRFRAPGPPAVAAPPPFTSQAALTLRGTTESTARIDLFVDEATAPVVTGATDAAGAFALLVALAPNHRSHLELFATAHGGRGLTSPPSAATLVHDGLAPTVAFQAPGTGAFVRQDVPIRVLASDAGSAVADLVLTTTGPPLAAALAPAPPADTVTAATTWSTTGLPDGTHMVRATATDRAGNSATASRLLIVDNTPPDTHITAGPGGALGDAVATFTFTGTDNLTPGPDVTFAWRVDGGAYTAFGPATTAILSSLAAGNHTFEVKARDLAGNEDPSPARHTFDLTTLRVTVTHPADGATVPGGTLLIRGDVEGGGDPAVSVNGLAASIAGGQWAAEIPLTPGHNTIAVAASTLTGARAAAAITVTAAPVTPSVLLRAVPASGVAPLSVTWRVSNQTGRPLVRLELDATGAGAFGAPAATLDGVRTAYASSGLVFPTLRATDDLGATYLATTLVQIDDARTVTTRFQGLWASFKNRLLAGDQPGALVLPPVSWTPG